MEERKRKKKKRVGKDATRILGCDEENEFVTFVFRKSFDSFKMVEKIAQS